MSTGGIHLEFNHLPALSAELHAEAQHHVAKATHDIEAHMKASMAEAKHGHWYGEHQASAPGEAPAIDTSTLASGIQSKVTDLHGVVGIPAEQAVVLEEGGAHVAPRPFALPAAEAVNPSFQHAMSHLL